MRTRTRTSLLAFGLGLLLAGGSAFTAMVFQTSLDPELPAVRVRAAAEDEVTDVALGFKRQVQEWKNVLLRGDDPADFEHHWQRFEAEEQAVRDRLLGIITRLAGEPELEEAIQRLLAAHARVGQRYREAVAVFTAGGARDPRGVDARVRGLDRDLAHQLLVFTEDLRMQAMDRRARAIADGADLRQGSAGLLGVLVLAGLAFFHFIVDRWITRPFRAATEAAETIASGRLDVPIQVMGASDARSLLAALEEMRRQLVTTHADLEEARDRALDATRAKAAFLASMSHEIRTPMNGVLGMLQLLEEKPLDAEGREFVSAAGSSAETLLHLLNDILDTSKIESGKLALESIPFDPRSCVEDVVQLIGATSLPRGVEVVCLVHGDVPARVRGDPTRLRQVVTNLVGNAAKFTEAGGSVLVTLSAITTDGMTRLRCDVEDTGIGIEEQDQQRLFEPFSQADRSTTRRFGGTGLGLVICKSIVDLMGGEIGLRSVPGRGSTFHFTITVPVVDGPAEQEMQRARADLTGRRALVADDNAANRRMLEYQLGRWGVQVTSATDGEAALAAVRTAARAGHPFDLLLLDYEMPGRDGLAVARELQAGALAGTRIVLLASLRERGELREAEKLGIAAYLTKPIRFAQLQRCLEVVLGGAPADAPEILTEASLAPDRPRNGGRILLVEDVEVNRRVAAALLDRMGCVVDVAVNGQDGFAAWSRKEYDLVLMDCHMPVLDGFAATERIRREEERTGRRRTVIVALTANAMTGDREACLNAGMDDHLAKPIQRQDLERALARWLLVRPDGVETPVGGTPEVPSGGS